ncbi:uncharacterized protein CcaverHIS019_0502050 [Cutaneotrichosporon cavernicola]|uniref:NAD(P)-binding protein n=1 Tax=Cutaneotrichosporon cavernicola TaxID=279322 RepID=A0AA48L5Y6_9TREE|nr:uncharacterized protein CcaverHIS019_0502050 [Cutaneotrichosporon cavernicola]BEI92577.1 hypothetical protein CcaverHIS019_0502050 [Cutaneotrichosporon cavernicola]
MTTEPPSFWDRSHVVWENAKHVGLPIINWLCGYKPRWTPAEMGSKAGQVILVTGANSGTGYATAQAYYNAGARVIMACRSEERANQAITEITSGAYRDINGTLQVPTTPPKTPGVLEFLALDLADLYSVEKAAKTLEKEKRLDVLFANAGIMAVPPAETKQGYALQFGTNVLGHQRLISRLLPLMQSTSNSTASPSRLIVSSSFAHLWAPKNGIDGGIAYDTLKGTGKLDKIKEYGESKWGGVALASAVWRATQLSCDEGALNQLWLANLDVDQARKLSGSYVACIQAPTLARSDLDNPVAWDKLWDWCEAEGRSHTMI